MRAFRSVAVCVGVLTALMGVAVPAHADSYYSESGFTSNAGATLSEGFETITWDSWIYHTRLPSPMVALDLSDDPDDPNDGPGYDLDGHFDITGNSIAYAPATELFTVFRVNNGGPDQNQYLHFKPWYEQGWPTTFDPDDPDNHHPIVTFDNFNNVDGSITAFALAFYEYTPSADIWIVMQFGDVFVEVDLSDYIGTQGNYFFGYVASTPFDTVKLHTNQNGGGFNIDDIFFSSPVPEPGTVLLVALGGAGLLVRRRWSKARSGSERG